MSQIIKMPNFSSINILEQTELTADVALGATQLTVVNVTGLQSNNPVLIGMIGSETAEILTLSSINSSTSTLTFSSPCINPHNRFEKLSLLFGNQARLYRAVNVDNTVPDDTAFSYLSIAVSMQGDDMSSTLTDPSGGVGYWYKTTIYNSLNGNETSLAAAMAVRGGGYGHYVSVDDIRIEAGLGGATQLDDSVFSARRDQAEAEINGKLAAAGYIIPLQTANGTAFTSPLVENITRLLAAGYVLNQDYGPTTDGDTKNGDKKIKQANMLLEGIQSQNIVLLDTTGTALSRSLQVSGWPDNTTAITGTDGVHGEPFQMTMSKRF